MKFEIDPIEMATVVEIFEKEERAGCPYALDPPAEAKLALRRWHSFDRRHRRGSVEGRVRDLVDGLVQAFEPEPQNWPVARREFQPIAEAINAALASLGSVRE